MPKSKKNMSKKAKISKAKNLGQLGMFFSFKARQAFNKLRQVFIKAPILNYFDLERYIYIKMDISTCYAIGGIFS